MSDFTQLVKHGLKIILLLTYDIDLNQTFLIDLKSNRH